MEHSGEFTSLLIVLGLAFAVPLLIGRIKILPVVVGEILAGLFFAQLGVIDPTSSPTLTLFANIGLAFLMFLAGMEIDLPSLFSGAKESKKSSQISLPLLALIIYLLTIGLGAGGSLLLNTLGMPGNMVLFTLILGATSLGVVLPVLKDREMMHTVGGKAIFLSTTVADFLTVILLTIYLLLFQNGLSLEILSFLLIFLAFIGVARFGGRLLRLPAVRKIFTEVSQATVQLKVRGAIVILLVFVVLAESLGIELILGAFLAGMLVAMFKSPQDEGLLHKLEAFGFGLFIPIFFIVTGANLNIDALIANPQSLVFLPVLFLISIIAKLVPALLLVRLIGWREAIAAGVLLNTHLTLEVAVAVIGEQLGLLSSATSAALIVFAVLTVVTMPILFNFLQPAAVKEPRRRMRLIFGWDNNLAHNVAQELRQHGENVEILSGTDQKIGIQSLTPETLMLEKLRECAGEIETVLALSLKDSENVEVSKVARAAGIQQVIAMVSDPAYFEELNNAGVQVFSPALFHAELITLMARYPNMFDLLVSTTDERDLLELTVRNPELEGRRLRDLALPGDSLVLSITRDGELVIPHGSTRLEKHDRISILVSNEFTEPVIQLFLPLASEESLG